MIILQYSSEIVHNTTFQSMHYLLYTVFTYGHE